MSYLNTDITSLDAQIDSLGLHDTCLYAEYKNTEHFWMKNKKEMRKKKQNFSFHTYKGETPTDLDYLGTRYSISKWCF